MSKTVYYIVKSEISKEYVNEFDKWYHEIHIPDVVRRSGAKEGKRFRAVEPEDKFMYMAIYEFANMETFRKYQESADKKELVADFIERFGKRAELKTSVWEEIYP